MKFTKKHLKDVLGHCGLLTLNGKADPEAPLVRIISAAMQGQENDCDAWNALEDEIRILKLAQERLSDIEDGK